MVTRENGGMVHIPDGMVHHWLAIGFIPGVTRDQAMALAQNYARHAKLYAPDVQRAEILSQEDQSFEVYYRFYRHALVTVVYNARFTAEFFTLDASRGYSFARSTRIAEVENPDKGNEREFPVGNDHGYLWRLNLYTRYLERDNGVYIQIEFLGLSRSVPPVFAGLVNPYTRSVPTDYLTRYIVATRKALQEAAAMASLKDVIASSVLPNISNTVTSLVICSTSFARLPRLASLISPPTFRADA
jgi:hypothetical protein